MERTERLERHGDGDLTAKKTKSKTDGQLRKAIVEEVPGTAMGAFGKAFDGQQIADLKP